MRRFLPRQVEGLWVVWSTLLAVALVIESGKLSPATLVFFGVAMIAILLFWLWFYLDYRKKKSDLTERAKTWEKIDAPPAQKKKKRRRGRRAKKNIRGQSTAG